LLVMNHLNREAAERNLAGSDSQPADTMQGPVAAMPASTAPSQNVTLGRQEADERERGSSAKDDAKHAALLVDAVGNRPASQLSESTIDVFVIVEDLEVVVNSSSYVARNIDSVLSLAMNEGPTAPVRDTTFADTAGRNQMVPHPKLGRKQATVIDLAAIEMLAPSDTQLVELPSNDQVDDSQIVQILDDPREGDDALREVLNNWDDNLDS